MPFDLDISDSVFIKDGEVRGLKLQLESLFGPLPEPVLQRIGNASKADLERWLVRVLRARSLDDVFAEPA